MRPLISIIVPIYNVEKYLPRCIDSIINQAYTNLEIILIDDGSIDNCAEICEKYAKEDNRIKVFHKKNGGLSDARNIGIEKTTGDYILFVDSDDYINKDTCQILINIIESCNSDIVIFKCREVVNGVEKQIIDTNKIIHLDMKEVYRRYLYGEGISHSACTKLYKKGVFKDIRFPKGKYAEDLGTTYKIFFSAQHFVYCDKALYNYDRRDNSIMGVNSVKLIIDAYDFECEKFEMETIHIPEYFMQAQIIYLNFILRTIGRLQLENKEIYNNIILDCKERLNHIDVKKLSYKSKLAYYFYKISPKTFIFLLKKNKII